MNQRKKVLLLGDINIDTTMILDSYPKPGQEGFATRITSQTGGSTANTALVLAKLGEDCGIVGSIGSDHFAETALADLSGVGIDIRRIFKQTSVTTGLNFLAVTPDGQRTMFGFRGANAMLCESHISKDIFEGIDLLHISGYAFLHNPQRDAAWKAISIARDSGIPISLDTGMEAVLSRREDIIRLLPNLEIGIMGKEECLTLLKQTNINRAVETLVNAGVKWIAIKLGGQGCLFSDGHQSQNFPAFSVDCVDSTGAGDSFSAGLISGWLNRLSIQCAVVMANGLGALATTVYGAGNNLPGITTLHSFFRGIKIRKKIATLIHQDEQARLIEFLNNRTNL